MMSRSKAQEIWERYVGCQSPEEFLFMIPEGETIEADVARYVRGIPKIFPGTKLTRHEQEEIKEALSMLLYEAGQVN